jgi:hypothetical protein
VKPFLEFFKFVMPGLVPGIHVFMLATQKTWMAGTSPAMTENQAANVLA